MIRNWYIQGIMYLILINNQIASFWIGDKTPHVSWSGKLGYPTDYHYWVIFDHRMQMYICIVQMVLALKLPPKGKYLNYGVTCIILNGGIALIEDLRYMYHGSNILNETLYFDYLILYTVAIVIAAFFHKIFNNGFS